LSTLWLEAKSDNENNSNNTSSEAIKKKKWVLSYFGVFVVIMIRDTRTILLRKLLHTIRTLSIALMSIPHRQSILPALWRLITSVQGA
jgi:hypothetical protein